MQGARDAGALERLARGVFGPRRHQARHLGLGDRDLLAAIVRKLDVGDGVIGGFGHEREKSFIYGGPSLTSDAGDAQ